jgi:hypothetical protein
MSLSKLAHVAQLLAHVAIKTRGGKVVGPQAEQISRHGLIATS